MVLLVVSALRIARSVILTLAIVVAFVGCRPKEPSLKDYTDFYNGIFYGDHVTVQQLLKRYPSLIRWEFNVGGYQGDTLMTAAVAGDPEMVELLLNAGAEPNYYTDFGVTPLMVAVEHGQVEVVVLLLDAGADVTRKITDGSTVFHYLGQFPNSDIANILLPATNNIDVHKNGGITPLTVAIVNYHNDLAFRFIEAGSSLEKALTAAPHIIAEFVLNNNREMLDYLWEQGMIDPYAMYEGNNLFHYASWYNNVVFVEQLLVRGMWDHTPNPAGFTPLDLAREYDSREVIEMVEQAGFARP